MKDDQWAKWEIDMLIELADGTRSAREIATIMNRPKGTIHGKVYRLRKKGVDLHLTIPCGRAGEAWTDAELIRLARMEVEGVPLLNMALRLNRSEGAISQKRVKLKDEDPDWPWSVAVPETASQSFPEWRDHTKPKERSEMKKRRCLGCGNNFTSWGKGNRICKDCKTPTATLREPDYSVSMQGWRF